MSIIASAEVASKCLETIITDGPALGLTVSLSKTTVWWPKSSAMDQDLIRKDLFPAIQCSTEDGVEILGGVISESQLYIQRIFKKRVMKCIESIDIMMELDDPQLCLLLLRACEGMKKLNYCWRTVHPSLITDAIDSMEQAIINTLREICVAGGPGFGNFQVELAALPIDLNGLGIALPSDVAAVAYAASSISTLSLQSLIFPELTTCIPTDARALVDSIMTQCRFTTTQKAE